MGEDPLRQEVLEPSLLLSVDHIRREERHAPRAAFAGRIHTGHRRVDSRRKIPLPHARRLEEAAVAEDPVDPDLLILHQDVESHLDRAQ